MQSRAAGDSLSFKIDLMRPVLAGNNHALLYQDRARNQEFESTSSSLVQIKSKALRNAALVGDVYR